MGAASRYIGSSRKGNARNSKRDWDMMGGMRPRAGNGKIGGQLGIDAPVTQLF